MTRRTQPAGACLRRDDRTGTMKDTDKLQDRP